MWKIFDRAGNFIGTITEETESPGALLLLLLFFFVVIATSITLILEHWFFLLLTCLILIALAVSASLLICHAFTAADLSARRCAHTTGTILFIALFIVLFFSGSLNYDGGSNWFENTLMSTAAYAVVILLGVALMVVVNLFSGIIAEKIVVSRSLESFRNSSAYTPMYHHYRDLFQNHVAFGIQNPKAARYRCTINYEILRTFNIPCKQDNLLMAAKAAGDIAVRTPSFNRYRISNKTSSSVELLLY